MFSRFKKWLKRSGIKYFMLNEGAVNPSNGDEMIDSLNPLDAVIENPDYPMARIYREDVWTGITDTFHVIMGNHFDLNKTGNGRVGILDIFIIPLIGRRLIALAYHPENNDILKFFAGIIGIPIEICRGIIAIGLTLFLSPIVALVHLFSYCCKASRLKNDVLDLKIIKTNGESIEPSRSKSTDPSTTMIFREWMHQNKVHLNEIAVNHKKQEYFAYHGGVYSLTGMYTPRNNESQFKVAHENLLIAVEAFKELNIGGRGIGR